MLQASSSSTSLLLFFCSSSALLLPLLVDMRTPSTSSAPTSTPAPLSRRRATHTGRVGNWELLREIHAGACCAVHLARPAGTQQCADYVVKALRDHVAEDQVACELLRNEVEASRAVQHPNLTTVLEAHLRSRSRCLVLPRIEGVSLDVLHRERQCGPRRALWTVRQVTEALAALHAAGWRHGDVKPANIMVSPAGHATLIDLSLAAPLDAPLYGLGTPQYAAPETTRGSCSAASDIYSLGVVLFELLMNDLPFQADSAEEYGGAHREEPLPVMDSLRPRGAANLIRRMLQKDPRDRPRAVEVVNELTPLEIQCFHSPQAV